MDKIEEYLKDRLKKLDYELGYYEDDDEGNSLEGAKQTRKEIDEVNNLLVLLSVGVRSEQYCECNGLEYRSGNGVFYCSNCGKEVEKW